MALRKTKKRSSKKKTKNRKSKRDSKRNSKSVFGSGASTGFKRAKKEQKEAKRRAEKNRQPFRFRLAVGEEAKIILTSKEPFFMYEHQFQDNRGRWSQFETCIKDQGNCPLCKKLDREGHYVMYISCVDTRTYTDRNGKKHKNTLKLLPVKTAMMAKFERLYKKYDTFRGIAIKLYRDTDKETNIGSELEIKGKMSESRLAKYKKAALPVDFKAMFEYPTEKEMLERYGGKAVAGSEDFADDYDDDLDDSDWD